MTINFYKLMQLRRCMQLYAQTFTNESQMMEVADLYPTWQEKLNSKADATVGEVLSYGLNNDGETQLYQVILNHTPQADWTPDVTTSLYKKVGFTDTGYNIWTQPLGASDAYAIGDIVFYNDQLWQSTVDNNVWQPSVYGWEVFAG